MFILCASAPLYVCPSHSFIASHISQDALKAAAEEHLKKQLSNAGVIDMEEGLPWLQDMHLVFGVKSSSTPLH